MMKRSPVVKYAVLITLLGFPPTAFAQHASLNPFIVDNLEGYGTEPVQISGGSTINSGQDIILNSQDLTSVNAGRDIVLNGTTVRRNVTAGREISGNHCYLHGSASAGVSVRLSHCPSVMQVTAGDFITLNETTVHRNVQSGRGLSLLRSLVEGDVTVGHEADIKTSTIEGTLSATSDRLTLDNSTVTHIHMYVPSATVFRNRVITGNGIISGNGQSFVRVGPNSVSNVNGYAIKGSELTTTLITPDEAVYVNGYKVAGTGPETYRDYRDMMPGAPNVQGPGWRDDGVKKRKKEEESDNGAASSRQEQVIELINNSRVTGRIVFESGSGKVIVRDSSEFYGEVAGGVVEKH